MNKFVKSVGLTAMWLTAHLSAQTNTNTSKQQPLFDQGLGLPDNKYPAAYNAPACIDVKDGWDFDIFGSFIYWHVAQDGMDIAYVPVTVTIDPTPTPGVVAYQRFTYQPGFKAGLGFDLNYDGWVCWAEYTWLHQSVTGSQTPPLTPTGAPGTWLRSQWFAASLLAETSVRSTWKTKFDQVDVVFSRPYYEGAQLTVSPYAGMRALWLRQNLKIFMQNADIGALNQSTSNNNSRCWSLGPVAGVLGHWLLGAGVRFEGNSAASLLYTRYTKIGHSEQISTGLPATVTNGSATNRNINALRPTVQIGVGLGWGRYFARNQYYFDLSARYDFLYYWHQNMMREVLGNMRGFADAAGDLEMHGLTATARFDF